MIKLDTSELDHALQHVNSDLDGVLVFLESSFDETGDKPWVIERIKRAMDQVDWIKKNLEQN
jgi:hypothetical protein